MTTPTLYVLVAWLLIYAPLPISGYFRSKMEGGYDNRQPRKQQAQATGLAARAIGAHNNGFEAFAPFAAASMLAAWNKADAGTVDALCVTFLVARALYVGFYLGDIHVLRSTAWFVGAGVTLALFVLAL